MWIILFFYPVYHSPLSMVSHILSYSSFDANRGKVCLLPHLGHVTGIENEVACHSISIPMNIMWQSVQRKGISPRIISNFFILYYSTHCRFSIHSQVWFPHFFLTFSLRFFPSLSFFLHSSIVPFASSSF